MASGTRQTNTASEGLRKLLGDIADMKLADDADLPFLIQLETMVLQHLKQGATNALNTSGAPVGLGGMSAPPPGMGGPPGVPGLMQGPSMPPGGPVGMPAGPAMMSGGGPNINELTRSLRGVSTASRLGSLSQRVAGM